MHSSGGITSIWEMQKRNSFNYVLKYILNLKKMSTISKYSKIIKYFMKIWYKTYKLLVKLLNIRNNPKDTSAIKKNKERKKEKEKRAYKVKKKKKSGGLQISLQQQCSEDKKEWSKNIQIKRQ